ncbi:restriction endonuclease subunit S [Bacteroides acidifaciens]|uniref:restriction endonuclease subunit S n=2 Tax=Bacteroides acidifaciens TaxID=85831 RepID=UPI0025B73BE8|nr:restriction endonuclease subunit S [Bacteroides acidifaciens]
MEQWKQYKLGELITLNSGGTPDKSNKSYWGGDIPWISAKFMYDDYLYSSELKISQEGLDNGSRLAPKGSILLLTRGSGLFNHIPVCYVMKDLAYNQDVKCIESNNKELVSTKFLFYWLMGNKNSIGAILETTGIGAGKIDTNRLKDIRISLPPKEYQQALIGFAESIMHKIELNRRINDNLEQQAQALFKSWFVDFEPFKNGKFVDSEMGMIPEGWKVGTIGEYCSIRSGYAFKSSWWQETGTKVIKIKNITDNKTLDMSDCSYVSSDKTYKAIDFQASPGDLIIAMTGATIGKFCIIPFHNDKIYINQRVGKFFLGNNPLDRLPFIYCCLSYEPIYNEIISKGQGSAQPNIGGADIENIRIILSPSTELKEFNSLLRPIFQKKMQIESELSKLSVLRDTLLPRLMSGELKINDLNC